MDLPRVTGVVWWKMGISHYKAIFRRASAVDTQKGYTKDFLQAPKRIGAVFQEMFAGTDPPYDGLRYIWPGGSFAGGRIYCASDYAENGRLEVGQWTQSGAPHPWQIGDPLIDPLIVLPGDPDASIPDGANAQWGAIGSLEPWLMMVQLDSSQNELHLRAYLGSPTVDLAECDLARVPEPIRERMSGQGGLAKGLPLLWFDPADFHDPWRYNPGDRGREASRIELAGNLNDEVKLPGTDYKPANETPNSAAPEPFTIDPNERDRATRAHSITQNALADAVIARGNRPLSPNGEPNYDLAWEESNGEFIVAEVKSITARNEERQLRLGLGQVLRYGHLLQPPDKAARKLLVTSAEPSDPRWVDLCDELRVGLIWPPGLAEKLDHWLDA